MKRTPELGRLSGLRYAGAPCQGGGETSGWCLALCGRLMHAFAVTCMHRERACSCAAALTMLPCPPLLPVCSQLAAGSGRPGAATAAHAVAPSHSGSLLAARPAGGPGGGACEAWRAAGHRPSGGSSGCGSRTASGHRRPAAAAARATAAAGAGARRRRAARRRFAGRMGLAGMRRCHSAWCNRSCLAQQEGKWRASRGEDGRQAGRAAGRRRHACRGLHLDAIIARASSTEPAFARGPASAGAPTGPRQRCASPFHPHPAQSGAGGEAGREAGASSSSSSKRSRRRCRRRRSRPSPRQHPRQPTAGSRPGNRTPRLPATPSRC